MHANTFLKTARRLISNRIGVILALLVAGFTQFTFAQQNQANKFASPGQAAEALYEALRSNEDRAVQVILGAGPELTSSGDDVVDKLEREKFTEKYQQMHRLVREPDGTTILYIGAENWPFPIPLVSKHGKYQFDAGAGADEIAARRIGENENSVIQVFQDLAKATQPGSDKQPNGDPAFAFARKLATNNPDALQPFQGYQFRIGSEQSAGVVLLAYPIDYGVSGVMTFIVLPGGFVYEKDLGPDTATLAPQIDGKPAGDWSLVE